MDYSRIILGIIGSGENPENCRNNRSKVQLRSCELWATTLFIVVYYIPVIHILSLSPLIKPLTMTRTQLHSVVPTDQDTSSSENVALTPCPLNLQVWMFYFFIVLQFYIATVYTHVLQEGQGRQ